MKEAIVDERRGGAVVGRSWARSLGCRDLSEALRTMVASVRDAEEASDERR